MRVLVFSDVHANLPALQAVLADAGDFDAAWYLGDIVGYGPDPNECIEIVRSLPAVVSLLGNHDAAVTGKLELKAFNQEARNSVLWVKEKLSEENLEYLKSLPEKQAVEDAFFLAHGSPRNPVWEYILDVPNAQVNFDYFDQRICFVGHTHLPIMYLTQNSHSAVQWKIPRSDEITRIQGRAILNPGSVGQPRDRNPMASYGIFIIEELTWEVRRVPYAIEQVQKRIEALGLPGRNAVRLAEGW